MSGRIPTISAVGPTSHQIILGLPVFVRTLKSFLTYSDETVGLIADDFNKASTVLKKHGITERVKLIKPNGQDIASLLIEDSWHLDPDFVSWLIKENKSDVLPHLKDVSPDWFQDLSTDGGEQIAQTKLFNVIKQKTAGWVAPVLNKPISFFFTRYLVKTSLTPNQITLLNLLLCIPIFFFLQSALYPLRAVGAILMQLSSIIDGCDGEIAKLKFKQSKNGGWFDTVADDLANNTFFVGIFLGLYWQSQSFPILVVGITSLLASVFATFVIYHGLLTRADSSNARDFTPSWQDETQSRNWFDLLRPLVKRDFFILILAVLVLFDFRLVAFGLGAVAMYSTAALYAVSFFSEVIAKKKS